MDPIGPLMIAKVYVANGAKVVYITGRRITVLDEAVKGVKEKLGLELIPEVGERADTSWQAVDGRKKESYRMPLLTSQSVGQCYET